ncbi:hypothetical protein [Williamsia muralis]
MFASSTPDARRPKRLTVDDVGGIHLLGHDARLVRIVEYAISDICGQGD